MALTVLVTLWVFEESLAVEEVARAIAAGVLRAMPQARVLTAPLVDGGEETIAALVRATGGRPIPVRVTGPVGEPVDAFFGLMGGPGAKTAVVEMAAAAGLRLVPRDRRDPTRTTSHGVGEPIRAALDQGVHWRRRAPPPRPDRHERPRPAVFACADRRRGRRARAALGPARGGAGVRPAEGGRAGAGAAARGGLERRAEAIRAATGLDAAAMPGTGASGGLGAGLVAFAGATLHPRFEIVLRCLDLDRLLEEADLVITAAGALDGQSPFGKVPCEVSRRAAAEGEPVIALAGTIGKGAATTFEHGIAAFASIVEGPCSLEEAIARAEKLLRRAAEDAMRRVRVGLALAGRRAA